MNVSRTATEVNAVLAKAQARCEQSGAKLTSKRRAILKILLESDCPLSAYDIVAAYGDLNDAPMQAMSVYRILDFLESEHFVHKLNSSNKYVACSHISSCSEHTIPQFLMCEKCNLVKEIDVSNEVFETLKKFIESSGFRLTSKHLEFQCVCKECAKT